MSANLESGEILEQVVHASHLARIRNVVFMGMGEPLNNYDAVLAALRAMTTVFCLAPKHLTLSTMGFFRSPLRRGLRSDVANSASVNSQFRKGMRLNIDRALPDPVPTEATPLLAEPAAAESSSRGP
ncbi:hypothetical protein PsorP6_012358 [Peronosclerospora sorghi]|uniref:Uncharacterized protein n=1 Tax=Peronosclerospora sorghi TaxID=230839 RepID=A0ACC0WH88_9STRA|nr:hypothetical protein PsorP6_012358 [Peronosclerospora sorghi]